MHYHSDQGVQCASEAYTRVLSTHGFHISMADKGNPYFIEQVRNQKRLHSSFDYVSPDEFEQAFYKSYPPGIWPAYN